MKTTSTLIIIIALFLCVLVIAWRSHILKSKTSQPVLSITTNSQKQAQSTSVASSNFAMPFVQTKIHVSNNAASTQISNDASNQLQQRLLADWQGNIDFYGKVVDENTNAIGGAAVNFQWVEKPSADGNRKATVVSDSNGLFELHNEIGLSLTVSVDKSGYYSSRKQRDTFNYGPLKGPPFPADPLNPVLFFLKTKGMAESLIHIKGMGLHTMRDYLLDATGKPTDVSLLTGDMTATGQGDLEVAIQIGSALKRFPSRLTWQCEIKIPGGGLLQTSEEFPFEAPENGYAVSDQISITTTNWAESESRHYYVKLRNGNFGRVNLKIISAYRPYFRLESFVNPSGSRNLEPAN